MKTETPSETMKFHSRFHKIYRQWLLCEDQEECDNLVIDMKNEVDDYLNVPYGN